MEPKDLVRRLFERAEEMGISTPEQEALSQLSTARLEQIRQTGQLTALEYERLCRALAVDAAAMFHERDPRRVPVRLRAAFWIERPAGLDLRLLALGAEIGRVSAALWRRLGRALPLSAHRDLTPLSTAPPGQDGYRLGEAARALLAPEEGPLYDLGELLRRWGVHVGVVALQTAEIDAASIWEEGSAPVILLNLASARHDHPGALRASLAHELCHLLHDAGAQDFNAVSWGSRDFGNYQEQVEVRARGFAPAFLAPPAQVRAWAQQLQPTPGEEELARLVAQQWGLSQEGAIWHAKNCDLFSEAAARRLQEGRRSAIDYQAFAPVLRPASLGPYEEALRPALSPVWDGWAAEVIALALEEGLLSQGRAVELLSWA